MKAFLIYVRERWWCRLPIALAIVFAFANLNTFFRQSIFGPKIERIPWCVWEDNILGYHEHQRPFWFREVLERLGFRRQVDRFALYQIIYYHIQGHNDDDFWDETAAVPVYLSLANDASKSVRRHVLSRLTFSVFLRGKETLPTLRSHLEDSDPLCRAFAAQGVWWGSVDAEVLQVILPLLQDPDAQSIAVNTLCQMAGHVPETFEPLAKLSAESLDALRAMHHFGKRSLAILRVALTNRDVGHLCVAIVTTSRLGKDAAELIPDLLALQGHPDPTVREFVAAALSAVDSVEFPPPLR